MREIKFRGKSKRTGQWIYGDLITSPNGLLKYIVQKSKINEAFLENLAPEEIEYGSNGEYTGLKDKNGKEIYEGDIINLIPDGYTILPVSILFDNGSFVYKSEGVSYLLGGWMRDRDNHNHLHCAVIGNIYENSELLEDTNDKE